MILYPCKMYAEYEDGAELYFSGNDEDDCMYRITHAIERHGTCTYYTCVNDDYYIDGFLRQ